MMPEKIVITETLPEFTASLGHTYISAESHDDLIRIYSEKCAAYVMDPTEREKLDPDRKLRILVRHGETPLNIENRLQGHEDNPMNERGIMQATHCGERMAEALKIQNIKFSSAMSSPLVRAHSTCNIILDKCGSDVMPILHPWLIERDFGVVSNWTVEEMAARYPGKDLDDIESVETSLHTAQRLASVLCDPVCMDCKGNMLIALHGGLLNATIKFATGSKIGYGVSSTTNCCVNVFSVASDNTLLLEAFNLTPDDFLRWVKNELI